MAFPRTEIEARLAKAFPEAQISVTALDAGQDEHFAAEITSPQFAGKSRIEQHRLVYAALGQDMGNALHALQLTTKTP